jgi:hypothetical protein
MFSIYIASMSFSFRSGAWHVLNCFICSDYDGLSDVRKQNKNDRIVNIDK